MEKIYIIGGSGFIGKNLARCYYNSYKIYIFDKVIDTIYFSYYPNIVTYQIDLVENELAAELDMPDFIINLASIVTAERDLSLFDTLISSNLKVFLNLFNRFKNDAKLKLFIQFGSSEEYGEAMPPFLETAHEEPNSPYALVKQLTTNTALMLHRNYKFPVTVVRPANLFGPLQHISKFVPYIIDSLRQNKAINVTPCEQKRDFLYVDDFAGLIALILQNYCKFTGEVVNVSSGESIALKSIIEQCKLQIGSTSTINYGAIPYRENEMMDLNCSVVKLEQLTGTKIQLNILERLNELIEIY